MSTPAVPRVSSRLTRSIAAVLSIALMALGLVLGTVLPAKAAGTPATSATPVPGAGGTVTITGTDFDPSGDGIYLGLGPVGLPGFYFGSSSLVSSETVWIAAGNPVDDTPGARTAPMNSDGTFSVTVNVPAPTSATPQYAVYTSKAHGEGVTDPSENTALTLVYAGIPAVTVTPSTGLDSTGATVTVTGTGFATTGPGIYVGLAPKTVIDESDWFTNAGYYTGVKWIKTADMGSSGDFTATLDLTAAFASDGTPVDCTAVDCGIYTFAAHGSADRSQDTYTPVAFTAPPAATATTTTLSASASSTAEDALDVTVTVAPSSAAGTVEIRDGSKTLVKDLPLSGGSATASLSGLAVGSHSLTAVFTPDDPAAFVASTSAVVKHTVAAAAPKCVANAVSGATLDWGVKTSFRDYISSSIANGSWTLTGVSYSSGAYHWAKGSGAYNGDAAKGTVRYTGTVAFSGHEGLLTLTLKNVRIQVTSATKATLIADVVSSNTSGDKTASTGVAFASIALSGAVSSSSSQLRVTNAPATLTSAGAAAFAGFYPEGTALDPVSFAFPLGATVECDSSTGGGLASTGGDASPMLPLIAGLLLAGGIAIVAVSRKRSAVKSA